MPENFIQLCYVTNDFERALGELQKTHAMGQFKELRDHRVPMTADRTAVGHFGLAFKGDTQLEVIEPLGGDAGIYSDFLEGSGFQMRFHHIGRHMTSFEEYGVALREAKAQWATPVDMAWFGGHYCYVDTRGLWGHYLELLCFPDGSIARDVPRY